MKKEKNLTKTLPSLRIDDRTSSLMLEARNQINKKNFVQISELEFRRLALFYFSQEALKIGGDINKLLKIED